MKYTTSPWKRHGNLIETDYAPNGKVIAILNQAANERERRRCSDYLLCC